MGGDDGAGWSKRFLSGQEECFNFVEHLTGTGDKFEGWPVILLGGLVNFVPISRNQGCKKSFFKKRLTISRL
jgi:hypothetical protein